MSGTAILLYKWLVFEKNEDALFDDATRVIEKELKPRRDLVIEMTAFKRSILRILEDYFFEKRGRRPLVLVDVIQL